MNETSGSIYYLQCPKCGKECPFTDESAYEIAKTYSRFLCGVCAGIPIIPKNKVRYSIKHTGKGLIWTSDGITYHKRCPRCNRIITFEGKCSRNNAISSVRRERVCRACSDIDRR